MQRDNSYLLGNTFAAGQPPNRSSFGKGSVPWNKGMKGLRLSPSTEFQPGHPPRVLYADGTITVRVGKRGVKRQHIKVNGRWVEYAKHLWIQAYSPLIHGDVVHHIDGDPLADVLDNLIALPRSHHPAYHSVHGLKVIPEDVLASYRARYVGRVAQ